MAEPGTFFRNFYIIAPLGEGGMSEVFLGYDVPDQRFVALKFLTGVFGTDKGAVGRLRREADIYRILDHPNVVSLVDTGSLREGGLFLVQEFLRGESIREAMGEDEARRRPLPPHRCMALLEDSAAALNAAHRKGIVHRDVKPDNIMVGPDGRGTVFDFGIASHRDGYVNTQAGTIMGTLNYACPEAREGRTLGPGADLFGLGAVFYETLTGELAIQAKNFQEILDHSFEEDTPPATSRTPGLPPVVDEICGRLMADEPEDRYPNLGELLILIGKLRLEGDPAVVAALFGDERVRHAEEALAAFREGDLARAKTTAARLLTSAEGEDASELQHLLGRIQQAEGHAAAAARAYARGLERDPANLDLALDFAMLRMSEKNYDGAREVLNELPSVIRGDFLVRSLLDTIEALPGAPPSAYQRRRVGGLWTRVTDRFRSLRALFSR